MLASELTAASLTLLPALTPEGKRGLWSLGGFTGSLLLLLLICCLYTGGTWFPTAALGTLLGFGCVFCGILQMKQRNRPEFSEKL